VCSGRRPTAPEDLAPGQPSSFANARFSASFGEPHVCGMTNTGYTRWSVDRSIAEAAALDISDGEGLSGQIVIFRIRISLLNMDAVFEGHADEDEYLIEGTVEHVEFSEDPSDEEEDDD
jgi:hypothetical protein